MDKHMKLFMKELQLSGYKVEEPKSILGKEFVIKKPFEGNNADIHLSITNKQYNVYLMPTKTTFIPDRFFWSFDEAADYIMELLRGE